MLHLAEAVSSPNRRTQLVEENASQSALEKFDQLAVSLPLHGRAFDLGYINVERLLTVLVAPFLKLTGKASQPEEATEGDSRLCQVFIIALHGIWSQAVRTVLTGEVVEDRCVPVMRSEKRTEMVNHMFETKFPEVRSHD